MKRKVLAVIMTLLLVMTMVPSVAFAASSDTQTESSVASLTSGDSTVYYDTINEARLAAKDGDTLKILKDVTLTGYEYAIMGPSKKLTLDLNGYTVTNGVNNSISVSGDLTITDTSEGKGGKITSSKTHSNGMLYLNTNKSALTVEAGAIENNGTGYAVNTTQGPINICGGTVYNAKGTGAIYAGPKATVEVSGGSVINDKSGGYTIYLHGTGGEGATLNATGGSIINTGSNNAIAVLIQSSFGTNIIDGATISNTGFSGTAIQAKGNLLIKSGTIESSGKGRTIEIKNPTTGTASVEMSGGTVTNTCATTGTSNVADTITISSKTAKFNLMGGQVINDSAQTGGSAINNSGIVNISGGKIASNFVGVKGYNSDTNISGGSIEAGTYAFQTNSLNVIPEEGQNINVTAGTALFTDWNSNTSIVYDNNIEGGSFDAPTIVESGTGNNSPIITGGAFSVSPLDYITDASSAVKYTSGEDTVFLVGNDITTAEDNASSGDSIEVLKGDVDLNISENGVEITNSGDGDVKINDEKLPEEGTITHVTHEMETISAKASTTTEQGNIEYYQCKTCEKYFFDKEGTKEISDMNDVLLPLVDENEGEGSTTPSTPAGGADVSTNVPTEDNTAQTGDDFNMTIPFALAGLALAGMTVAVATRKRHN